MSAFSEAYRKLFPSPSAREVYDIKPPEPRNSLVVACKGDCGRVFTAMWDSGIKCRIASLHCTCGAVTPVDGEVNER